MSLLRPTILLASASPRRRGLITLLGVTSDVLATQVDESPLPKERPEDLAHRLARAKAAGAISHAGSRLILAADSVVVLDGEPLGKPGHEGEAVELLRRLRGRDHEVITAVVLRDPSGEQQYEGLVRTRVSMRLYSDHDIAAYVATGSPMDKAGAYGIQDAPFRPVAGLQGCYPNVIGLPLCEVRRALEHLGIQPAFDVASAPCEFCRQAAEAFGEHDLNGLFPTSRKD